MLMDAFKNSGYNFGKFNGNISNQKSLIIRHDIDIDLGAALEMAKLESEMGVKSTYFISMRSPFYNPFSASNANRIKHINALGHDVGTHIGTKLAYKNPFEDIKILQSNFPFLNEHIATVHHPGSMDAIRDLQKHAAIKSTYAQILNNSVDYISDSTGKWRYGHPLESNTLHTGKSVILLTHPIWWVAAGDTPFEKITNALKKDALEIADVENFLPTFFKDNYR